MTWLDSKHIDYKEKCYCKTWSDIFPGNRTEKILADSVDQRIVDIIRDSFESHFGRFLGHDLSGLMDSYRTIVIRQEIAQSALDCSNDLRERLPFIGFRNCYEFIDRRDEIARMMRKEYPSCRLKDDKIVWAYYLKEFGDGMRLSELSGCGFLDCAGQALAIKMSLGEEYGLNGFGVYNQQSQNVSAPNGTISTIVHVHALAALKLGKDFYLKIDPTHSKGENSYSFLERRFDFWNSFADSDMRVCK